MNIYQEMVRLQHNFNKKIFEDYLDRNLNWNNAIIVESGELLESLGYKWWKHQEPDMENVKVEAIDLLHFVISEDIQEAYDYGETGEFGLECVANEFEHIFTKYKIKNSTSINNLINGLNYDVDGSNRYKILKAIFKELDMSNADVYIAYIVKNSLNELRQKYGYKDGTYIKDWNGKEDNVIAYEIAYTYEPEELRYEKILAELEEYYKQEVLKSK